MSLLIKRPVCVSHEKRRLCFAEPRRSQAASQTCVLFCSQHPSAMDFTYFRHTIVIGDALRIIALSIGSAVFVLSLRYLLISDPERAADYEISIPEQCKPGWKGEELDEPSIKVCDADSPHHRHSHAYVHVVWCVMHNICRLSDCLRYLDLLLYNATARLPVNHSDFSTQSLQMVLIAW